MEELKKKRGRPLKDGARRNQKKMLLNDDEFLRLQRISEKSGINQSDIMRTGMSMYINHLEKLFADSGVGGEISDFENGMYDEFDFEDDEF